MATSKSRDSSVADDPRTERHRNLIRLAQQADLLCQRTTDPEKKRYWGEQRLRINTAIHEEKKARPKRQDLPRHFIESAKEMLPRGLFETILRDAQKKWDAEAAEIASAEAGS